MLAFYLVASRNLSHMKHRSSFLLLLTLILLGSTWGMVHLAHAAKPSNTPASSAKPPAPKVPTPTDALQPRLTTDDAPMPIHATSDQQQLIPLALSPNNYMHISQHLSNHPKVYCGPTVIAMGYSPYYRDWAFYHPDAYIENFAKHLNKYRSRHSGARTA
jgi:hypothetical protein